MSVTRTEILKRIQECELLGEFDRHVDPVDMSKVIKVDGDYHYIKHGMERAKYSLEDFFVVRPYTQYINRFIIRSKINGRENLRGIRSAVVTSNHVYMFDCLAIRRAMRGHKLYTVAAPFNNMTGFLGEMMRAGGMMPLSNEPSGLMAFNRAVRDRLSEGNYLLVYPEQAMWWMYEKPRPFKDGAFYIAAKNNVPVIPCFITYKYTGKYDEEGIAERKFVVNILEPIYPREELSLRENTEYLRDADFAACRECYESFYGRDLEYTCSGMEKYISGAKNEGRGSF